MPEIRDPKTQEQTGWVDASGKTYTIEEWKAIPWQQKNTLDPGGFTDNQGSHPWEDPNDPNSYSNRAASGDPFKAEGGDKQLLNYFGGIGNAFGFVPKQVDEYTAGASLDTGAADAERERTTALLSQLQQQAATGGGEWEKSLADATAKAGSTAQAVGQSQPGSGYATALRNIGNAQGAVAQRAVGQGNILREQSKQSAQDQISALATGQGEQDINQAEAEAKAAQGVGQLNSALSGQANKNLADTASAAADIVLSDGGRVPGKAPVFGDDERNDIVDARLSPGEIVIPRSHAHSPEAAAEFVRALKGRGPQKLNAGGTAGDDPNNPAGSEFRDDAGMTLGSVGQDFGKSGEAASIKNGGLLNQQPYEQARQANVANQDLLVRSAAGQGPSTAPQELQNDVDSSIAAAMQAGVSGRQPAGDVVSAASTAAQGAAGNAAATTAGNQRQGQQSLGQSLARQRALDLSMATARREAAWRNTQLAAGLGLEQQALLRSMTGKAGQAGAAFAAADSGGSDFEFGGSDSNTPSFDQGLDANEFESYPGQSNPADLHNDTDDKWAGGEIEDPRAADFVRSLKRRARA